MLGKIYGLEELNKTLPLVRSIVGDIMHCHLLLKAELTRIGINEEDAKAGEEALLRRLSWDARDLLDEIRGYIRELAELGVFLRDPTTGMVEAYGERGADIVYYTWRLGEDSVRFWHGLFGSHRERLPVCAAV
jgi:hypothetical protein